MKEVRCSAEQSASRISPKIGAYKLSQERKHSLISSYVLYCYSKDAGINLRLQLRAAIRPGGRDSMC